MMGKKMICGRYGTWPQKEWIVGKGIDCGRREEWWEKKWFMGNGHGG